MKLAFGFCVGPSGKYEKIAQPALRRVIPDAHIIERRNQTSIFEAYNSIIDEYLESRVHFDGLVLMHEDVELREDPTSLLADLMARDDVSIVGVIGGRGVNSVRWARADEKFGHAEDTFYGKNHYSAGTHEVDTVDGLFLAMSNSAVRQLRFDTESFHGFHAYDADICMQARARGSKVLVADLDLIHHTKGGFGDVGSHRLVDDVFRKKWGIPLDSTPYRWKQKVKKLVY